MKNENVRSKRRPRLNVDENKIERNLQLCLEVVYNRIKDELLLLRSGEYYVMGSLSIVKNGDFHEIHKGNVVIEDDIILLESAIMLSYCMQLHDKSDILKARQLVNSYDKNFCDLRHYEYLIESHRGNKRYSLIDSIVARADVSRDNIIKIKKKIKAFCYNRMLELSRRDK